MSQHSRFLPVMRSLLGSAGISILALLCLSSCSSGPSNSSASPVKKNSLRAHPPVNYAFATKDEITEGDDLEIKLEVTVPDSTWTVDDPEQKVEGNTIKITPGMNRPRGSSATAIAASRNVTKTIKGLQAGKYKVVVVNEGGKNKEFDVAVKPKAG